jgi:hypothetical protein
MALTRDEARKVKEALKSAFNSASAGGHYSFGLTSAASKQGFAVIVGAQKGVPARDRNVMHYLASETLDRVAEKEDVVFNVTGKIRPLAK